MEIYPRNQLTKSIGTLRSDELQCEPRQAQVMTQEQFTQVFEAILDGKYSWACVLTLKFAGYNPLHYIPYRTYKRLLKENGRKANQNEQIANSADSCSEAASCRIHSDLQCSSDRSKAIH